jgi:hypothetical protein
LPGITFSQFPVEEAAMVSANVPAELETVKLCPAGTLPPMV